MRRTIRMSKVATNENLNFQCLVRFLCPRWLVDDLMEWGGPVLSNTEKPVLLFFCLLVIIWSIERRKCGVRFLLWSLWRGMKRVEEKTVETWKKNFSLLDYWLFSRCQLFYVKSMSISRVRVDFGTLCSCFYFYSFPINVLPRDSGFRIPKSADSSFNST